MRIISQFHDYYDGVVRDLVAYAGGDALQDPDVTYVRNRETRTIRHLRTNKHLYTGEKGNRTDDTPDLPEVRGSYAVLRICNKIYLKYITGRPDLGAGVVTWCTDHTDVDTHLERVVAKFPKAEKAIRREGGSRHYWSTKIHLGWGENGTGPIWGTIPSQADREILKDHDPLLRWFDVVCPGEPIVHLSLNHVDCSNIAADTKSSKKDKEKIYGHPLTVNPNLSQLIGKEEIVNMPDPWWIAKELMMFLGNIAAEDVTPEMNDKIKIEGHGFDLKKSFRKRPSIG